MQTENDEAHDDDRRTKIEGIRTSGGDNDDEGNAANCQELGIYRPSVTQEEEDEHLEIELDRRPRRVAHARTRLGRQLLSEVRGTIANDGHGEKSESEMDNAEGGERQ